MRVSSESVGHVTLHTADEAKRTPRLESLKIIYVELVCYFFLGDFLSVEGCRMELVQGEALGKQAAGDDCGCSSSSTSPGSVTHRN
jgi:hypothetical protein